MGQDLIGTTPPGADLLKAHGFKVEPWTHADIGRMGEALFRGARGEGGAGDGDRKPGDLPAFTLPEGCGPEVAKDVAEIAAGLLAFERDESGSH